VNAVITTVRNQILSDRKKLRKRCSYTLRTNGDTNKTMFGDIPPPRERAADDLTFTWGEVAIERDESLPDNVVVLVVVVPA
jgi:hypothetical protein